MKKTWTTPKYKRNNKTRADKHLRRQISSKEKKKRRRRQLLNLPKKAKIAYEQYYQDHKHYVKIKAPENFSFVDSTDEVVIFINKLKRQHDKGNKVFVILKEVEHISYDAIVVLLSIMVKFKADKIGFNGDFPNNPMAKRKLKQSGFFEYLLQPFKDEDRYRLAKKSSIHTHAWKNVDPELGQSIIKEATKTVWGESKRCQGVQRAMLELMLNTNNHAALDKEGEKHWWLSVKHDKENNKAYFSFIDFGVGIFYSLNNKTEKSKFYGWKEKMKNYFKDHSGLLELILDGELHRTVTGKHYRGRGLPGIKDVFNRNQISNLSIITNNVKGDVEKGEYKKLKDDFSGTFVYWELNTNNEYCNGRIEN